MFFSIRLFRWAKIVLYYIRMDEPMTLILDQVTVGSSGVFNSFYHNYLMVMTTMYTLEKGLPDW
ncbi:hypothetical protein KO02_13325 [Sphingobacterium sp. ML3W]|nr:hypothetical protein KO02_13325 [Sphingobacterium sp. ML3W]